MPNAQASAARGMLRVGWMPWLGQGAVQGEGLPLHGAEPVSLLCQEVQDNGVESFRVFHI
jgi:hypothetical protein